jgi:hypothetical protein
LVGTCFKDQAGDGRITLRWILGKQVMRLRAGWNWPWDCIHWYLCISSVEYSDPITRILEAYSRGNSEFCLNFRASSVYHSAFSAF